MKAFEKIWPFVLDHEGGYCNDPGDPGGPTKYGVSLRWLNGQGMDVNKDGKIDAADIRALTPDDAKNLFKHYFWDYLKLDDFPPKTAEVMFDTAVNAGTGQAVKFLQRACNAMTPAQLAVDGALGPRTMLTVKELAGRDTEIARNILEQRDNFYRDLAAKPATKTANYALFLKGWLNRTRDLRAVVEVA